MTLQRSTPARPPVPCAHGFVLIAALAVLVMLTLLALAMFHGLGIEEKIAGNVREKTHAFYAAQSALQYAESSLAAVATLPVPIPCSQTVPATTLVVCQKGTDLSQQQLATTIWNQSFGTTFIPPNLLVNNQPLAQMLPNQYANYPQYAITYIGTDPGNSTSSLYQVTAQGFGGNSDTVAVVQSIYALTLSSSNVTCVSCAH